MKIINNLLARRGHFEPGPDLLLIESKLQNILSPVEPRPQFVKGLRKRLSLQRLNEDLVITSGHQQVVQTGILITSGIMGSLLMFISGIRGLVSVICFVGLLISWLKQNSQDSLSPSNATN